MTMWFLSYRNVGRMVLHNEFFTTEVSCQFGFIIEWIAVEWKRVPFFAQGNDPYVPLETLGFECDTGEVGSSFTFSPTKDSYPKWASLIKPELNRLDFNGKCWDVNHVHLRRLSSCVMLTKIDGVSRMKMRNNMHGFKLVLTLWQMFTWLCKITSLMILIGKSTISMGHFPVRKLLT